MNTTKSLKNSRSLRMWLRTCDQMCSKVNLIWHKYLSSWETTMSNLQPSSQKGAIMQMKRVVWEKLNTLWTLLSSSSMPSTCTKKASSHLLTVASALKIELTPYTYSSLPNQSYMSSLGKNSFKRPERIPMLPAIQDYKSTASGVGLTISLASSASKTTIESSTMHHSTPCRRLLSSP